MTRERMPSQEDQQIDLPLDLHLALDLVDAEQKLPLARLQQVVAVDRALGNSGCGNNAAEAVIVGDLFEDRLTELGIDSHCGICSLDQFVASLKAPCLYVNWNLASPSRRGLLRAKGGLNSSIN